MTNPTSQQIAAVRFSNAGPYLDICGVQVASELGTTHDERYVKLAQQVNEAFAKQHLEQPQRTTGEPETAETAARQPDGSAACPATRSRRQIDGGALSSKHESPLRQYFRIRPVIEDGEPDAQRIEFHVGNQTFNFGPEYCESKEHAEWFVSMAIKAMHNAFKGMCNKCDGHGYVDEGDSENGPCPETCDECGGKGKTTPVETSDKPVVWVVPGDDNANMNGFVDARFDREGEFTRPLYAKPVVESRDTPACLWQRDDPDNEFFFNTACGQEGVDRETSWVFCPHCGKRLTTQTPEAACHHDWQVISASKQIYVCKLCARQMPCSSPEEPSAKLPKPDCADCGMEYGTDDWLDTVLTLDQWKLIGGEQAGILCANCIVKRASRLAEVVNLSCRITFRSDFRGPDHDVRDELVPLRCAPQAPRRDPQREDQYVRDTLNGVNGTPEQL